MTKDTRSKKKNKLCWFLCLGIIAAAIILGILAAGWLATRKVNQRGIYWFNIFTAGVFQKTEPTPVEARQYSGKDIRTGSIIPIGGSDVSNGSTTEQPIVDTTTPEALTTLSDEEYINVFNSEDDINYVENTLEGQLTLDKDYNANYADNSSDEYKTLVGELEMEIKKILPKDNDNQFYVKILSLK